MKIITSRKCELLKEHVHVERTTKLQDCDIAGGEVRGWCETGARVASTLQPLSSTPAIAKVAPWGIDTSFSSRRKIRSDTISVSCLLRTEIFLNQRDVRPIIKIVTSPFDDSAQLDNVTALFVTTINRLIPIWLTGVTLQPIISCTRASYLFILCRRHACRIYNIICSKKAAFENSRLRLDEYCSCCALENGFLWYWAIFRLSKFL